MILWIWAAVLVAAIWLYFKEVYSQLSKRGVKHLPIIPFFGHAAKVLLGIQHPAERTKETYDAFPGERFVGQYDFLQPSLIIRDLDLIKKVTVKDFEHFVDHRKMVQDSSDDLTGKILFLMKGQAWKDMRSTLSPAFTSSKMRMMIPFMSEVGDQMNRILTQKIIESKEDYIDVDVKDLTTKYANDVIATCAFGLKVDSLADENNEFYQRGKELSHLNFKRLCKIFAVIAFPGIMEKLKFSLFTKSLNNFFRDLVFSTMEDREKNHNVRPDMIHLLMEVKKGKLTYDTKLEDADAGFATVEESDVGKKNSTRVWTDDDLAAQVMFFLLAGFETVATTMSFLLHELAMNPEVQEKLYNEIKEHDARNNGTFDYNSVQQMKYLDMVVSETLRLWTSVTTANRVCTQDYNLGKPNEKATQDYILRKGDAVIIPTWALHRDPEYFPDPLKFDPERFSDDNKHKIKPGSYLPFGAGPRNCIGSRFALCEVKMMIYQLLRSFELSPAPKTQIPAVLSKRTFNIRIQGGHWLRMSARK